MFSAHKALSMISRDYVKSCYFYDHIRNIVEFMLVLAQIMVDMIMESGSDVKSNDDWFRRFIDETNY